MEERIDLTPMDYFKMILKARIYDLAVETPLTHARNLSQRFENSIYFKREDMQPVFSFKLRGAYNKIQHLSEDEKASGVIACSAGNHAQGVALAAQKLGLKAKIVMPIFTPSIKVNSVRNFGAEVILHGNDFDGAKTECFRLVKETGMTLIHPYDDPLVIAGQGTIGMEILRQLNNKDIHAIFCAVGGGGLISGIGCYVKTLYPHVKIIGVETHDANAMYLSLQKGERVELKEIGIFADGAAVKLVGEETFRLSQQVVDEVVLVSNDELCAAIKDTFVDCRTVLEPAAALSVAGAKKYIKNNNLKNENFVCVLSGANVDFNRLRFIAERAEIGENREVMLSVIIPEKPGTFYKLYSVIYPRNVTEVSYRYHGPEEAFIYIAFEVQDPSIEVPQVMQALEKEDMKPIDITQNEMAKSHARYLVGGRSSKATNEHLYRFEFPQRPNSLYYFLKAMQSTWNVSLFHYRNQGHDVGRVLAGIQVPPEEKEAFQSTLDNLGYRYVDESNNPVYLQFLK